MNSQTYVTDPVMWENFYKDISKKSVHPYKFRNTKKNNQTGRGLYRRYKGSYLIPVNSNSNNTDYKLIPTKQVSHVEADANRAKSELK